MLDRLLEAVYAVVDCHSGTSFTPTEPVSTTSILQARSVGSMNPFRHICKVKGHLIEKQAFL